MHAGIGSVEHQGGVVHIAPHGEVADMAPPARGRSGVKSGLGGQKLCFTLPILLKR